MNNDVVIKVENVSKKYCKSLRSSMAYGIQDIIRNSFGLSAHSQNLRKGEFWAVDDVSFELRKGETLGLIGPNGAGKTTLLKMFNGIFWPDKGKITVKGKVGALIVIGAGFHPLLTGRENIYINGAILGMNKREIDKKFDSIIDFADIGDFLDTPVKNYSSGMYVRLGFAIAVHCDPDVLLIDEVLAVGDVAFRARCYNRIAELVKNCAVIFVSHNMSAIVRTASKCIVLKKGENCFYGTPGEAVQYYYSIFEEDKMDPHHIAGSNEAKVQNLRLYDQNNNETDVFQYNDSMKIFFDTQVSTKYKSFLVSITFMNQARQLVAQCHSSGNNMYLKNTGCLMNIQVTLKKIIFNPGKYTINIIIFDESHQRYLCWHYNTKVFSVKGEFVGGADIQLLEDWEVHLQ